MGKGADDIAGEIVNLREESDVIVDELLRRAKLENVARGATATLTSRASTLVSGVTDRVGEATESIGHMADDMPEPIRKHSMAATYTVIGALAATLGFALSWASVMRRPTASERAAERLRAAQERAQYSLSDWLDRIEVLRHGMRNVRVVTVREEPSMLKRAMWAGLVSLMATLGSLLFKRMTAGVWRTAMKEDPPRK